MSSQSQETKPKEVRVSVPSSGPRFVTKKGLTRVLKDLVRQMGFRLQVDGAEAMHQTHDGLYVKVGGGGEVGTHPFFCGSMNGDGDIEIEPGQVNGENASGYTLEGLATSGTVYVYIAVEATLVTTSDDYVLSGDIVEVTLVGSSTPLTSSDPDYYREIARYVDGVKTQQTVVTSLEVVWHSTGLGDGSAFVLWGAA